MVTGERCEDERGVDQGDVEVVMRQLDVDRNSAVKALKHAGGDVVDAMLNLGNK